MVIDVCSPLTSILPESPAGQTSPGAAFTRSAGRTSAIIISTHPRSTAIPALLTFAILMDSRPSLCNSELATRRRWMASHDRHPMAPDATCTVCIPAP